MSLTQMDLANKLLVSNKTISNCSYTKKMDYFYSVRKMKV